MKFIKLIGFLVFCYGGVFVKFEPAEFGSLKPLQKMQKLSNSSGVPVQKDQLTDGFWLLKRNPVSYLCLYRVENGHHLCDFVNEIFASIELRDTNGQLLSKDEIYAAPFFRDMHKGQKIGGIYYKCRAFSLDGKTIYMKQCDYSFYPLDERFAMLNPVQVLHVLSGNKQLCKKFPIIFLKPALPLL